MTLFDLLEQHATVHAESLGERTLLVTPDGTFTSADVRRESAKIAAWLRGRGLVRGDRVVIDLKNGFDAVVAMFGVARAGGVVVGATPQWSVPQLKHVVADSEARFLVTGELRAKQLGAARPPNVLARSAGGEVTSWDALTETWDAREAVEPNEPAIIIYTSGSTGAPKGVVHPHANLVDFARVVSTYLENGPNDRLMWLLGWSFGYGLSQLLTMCAVGGSLIVPASMLPADVVKAHEEHGATAIAQVPFGWDQLVTFLEKTGRTLSGLRYVTNAGDGPPAALLDRLPGAFPFARIVLMYGQTECLRTTYLPPHLYETKRGAMGYPIPGVDVYVVNADGVLADVDEPGELLHRGALLARGYWRAPDATQQKFCAEPCLRELIGDEPVLHTGDIVRRDADGCLWYVARSERMIKSSGFRFGPSEIEAILRAAPSVRDAVAFGVDDPALGQAVEVAVVPSEADVNVDALHLELKKRLPRYMWPRRIHVIGEIPRNANGKVKLDALRELDRATS